MPYKKGPKGSLRKYSSSTGRYIKDTDPLLKVLGTYANTSKVSKKERKYLHLYNKASQSNDPYLFEVFKYLYENGVCNIELINEMIKFSNPNKVCEVDILTKNALIEIKSSRYPGCLTQALRQKQWATENNRKAILYAPNISHKVIYEYTKRGINVVTSLTNLLKEVKTI